MWPNPEFPVDLLTYTEEILNKKLHFFAVVVSIWLVPIWYLFVYNQLLKHQKTREIGLTLTIKTQERHHWRCICVFIVDLEHIQRSIQVFPFLSLNKWMLVYTFGLGKTMTTELIWSFRGGCVKCVQIRS